MKKLFVILLLATLNLNPGLSQAADMPQAGMKAPNFTLPGQDGKDVSLPDYRGKWVVLYFYPKDFTQGCSMEAHNFQADSAKFRTRNAVIIGVSVDSVHSHTKFCAKEGLDFKLLSDAHHTVTDTYGSTMERNGQVLAARNSFLIGPDGVIRKVYVKANPVTHSKDVLTDIDLLQGDVHK